MLYLVRVMISTVDDFRHTYNFTAIVPLYNGETAPKAMRGMLLVLYQLQIIVGFVCSTCRNSITSPLTPAFAASFLVTSSTSEPTSSTAPPLGVSRWAFNWPGVRSSFPASSSSQSLRTLHLVALFLSSCFSRQFHGRRHLLGTGKEAEARRVVADLNGLPEDDPIVVELIEELEFGIRAENEGGKATWLECFSERNLLWKRTINGIMLQFIQQLNGQNFYCEPRLILLYTMCRLGS